MRALAILIAFGWFFAWLTSPSAAEKERADQKIDSLTMVNKSLMENLLRANTTIDWANEIIENPKLVLRVDSVPVQVFREKKK
jgi:hypothetical protein